MIPECGHFALILAFCFAMAQIIFSGWALLSAQVSSGSSLLLVKPSVYGQSFFLMISFICLVYAFVTNDFSVAYVAENSNTHLPLIYKMTAIWGAHEGSLLLWVTVLSIWSFWVCFFSKGLPPLFLARVVLVLGAINIGFLLFLVTTSNPFIRLLPNFPIDGRDLNPLLQDPGLAGHPPMLYMGYVGFAVTFAFAMAALIEGKMDTAWARSVRPWALLAWCFLTLGITLGSWWAYRVLGWGGWWFWDPVENASLLPWLAGTAFIHSLMVTEKRNHFKSWTALLAIITFSLSLLGTFLVRSGILTSVHAFAIDPARGSFMLKFLFLVIGSSLLLYAKRASLLASETSFSFLSREVLLLLNNVILMVSVATILLGTLYPLILDTLNLGKISVGAPYFNTIFIPLMMVFMFLMGIGPHVRWQRSSLQSILQRLVGIASASFLMAFSLPWILQYKNQGYVLVGLLLSFWIILSTVHHFFKTSRKSWGMLLAHSGIAICAIGITLTSAFSVEKDVRMKIGEQLKVGPYEFQFQTLFEHRGPNYKAAAADFNITHSGKWVGRVRTEKRFFIVQQTAIASAGIHPGLFRDLYVALGEPLSEKEWSVRIYYKPFVRWIWLGGLVMMLGGIISWAQMGGNKKELVC